DPRRLARISAMGLVDGQPPEEALQRIVQETAQTFGVPIALISIVLGESQWFKAHVGLSGRLLTERGTPINEAFCRHVVDADTPAPLVVPDAASHPFFADNVLVREGSVGSYAGAPLLTPAGDVLGTLCIIDSKPLAIDAAQIDLLVGLARRVAGELELRTTAKKAQGEVTRLRHLLESEQNRNKAVHKVLSYLEVLLSSIDVGVMLMDTARRIIYANQALAEMAGLSQDALVSMMRIDFVKHVASLSDNPEDLLRRVHVLPTGPFVACEQFELARPERRVLRWVAKPVEIPGGVAQLSTYTDITAQFDLESAREPLLFLDVEPDSL
ncbi:MAG: GAF domain-containing protein, partial [Byssovorax sp.]